MQNLNIENARIGYKNFRGLESKYNAQGNRTFSVFIDDVNTAEALIADGWNLKVRNKKDVADGEDPKYHLPVSVKYGSDYYRPRIFQITSSGKTLLTEETVDLLDYSIFEKVDLSIRPYEWEVNGTTGIKAYVDEMYVTIQEGAFASKYSDIPSNDNSADMDIPF